jgi:GH15 family glucan-1,4-alpha-glucosidase
MGYQPIENYGIIGDLHSVALIGKNGSIDWYCTPRFDSPSIFAALLDDQKGGYFRIAPADTSANTKQLYFPDTNVLITRFLEPSGVAELEDFMPIYDGGRGSATMVHQIIRRVTAVRGTMKLRMWCHPAFDYARAEHEVVFQGRNVCFASEAMTVGLVSPIPLRKVDGGVEGEFSLRPGESVTFYFRYTPDADIQKLLVPERRGREALRATADFWRRWLSKSKYMGRWQEMVHRSALTLKLLTYAPTGAIVAAPTTSLPEEVGGVRNWDYRFTWIRDASFTLYALINCLGFTEEAAQFMDWLAARMREVEPDGSLQIMYGIDGRHELTEETLDHLSGYRGSHPVRIGNGAYNQMQLDIYGEMIDSVYLYNKYGAPISYDLWTYLRRVLDWVCKNWEQPDEGIWEVRGGRRHFVHSKMQCWVALERAIRLANFRGLPADIVRWQTARDQIYEDIMAKGWNTDIGAFVQYYGSDVLDASNLLLPLVKFMGPNDPRMASTLERTRHALVSDSLVYRYDPSKAASDGLPGSEGTFSICTFWLVECLTRSGRLDEARLIFEKMLTYANHLGLYAEEIGASGEALGNFPQAFTHLALISAAYNLDRAMHRGRGG